MSCEIISLDFHVMVRYSLHMPKTTSHKTLAQRLGPIRESRSIHLVDAENLIGSPTFDRSEVGALKVAYCSVAPVRAQDLVVIASSHHSAIALAGWPMARSKWRSGPDGADLALIDVITQERVTDRFKSVVIGSGDGIFADVASGLRDDGVSVTVVSRIGSLAYKLHTVADEIRYLPLVAITATVEELAESA